MTVYTPEMVGKASVNVLSEFVPEVAIALTSYMKDLKARSTAEPFMYNFRSGVVTVKTLPPILTTHE